jgi:hypothetical protein
MNTVAPVEWTKGSHFPIIKLNPEGVRGYSGGSCLADLSAENSLVTNETKSLGVLWEGGKERFDGDGIFFTAIPYGQLHD